jgi:hypothetical protein
MAGWVGRGLVRSGFRGRGDEIREGFGEGGGVRRMLLLVGFLSLGGLVRWLGLVLFILCASFLP